MTLNDILTVAEKEDMVILYNDCTAHTLDEDHSVVHLRYIIFLSRIIDKADVTNAMFQLRESDNGHWIITDRATTVSFESRCIYDNVISNVKTLVDLYNTLDSLNTGLKNLPMLCNRYKMKENLFKSIITFFASNEEKYYGSEDKYGYTD